jgi:hypothetical protein
MTFRVLATICISIVILLAAAAPDEKASPEAKPASGADQIAGMKWIAGTWSGPMWGGEFETWYCTPEGGKVISYSTLRKQGKLSFYEFEVFEVNSKGQVVFRPFPKGGAATPLILAEADASSRKVVFENKKKDFPTRITYHRVADDRLVITLSDPFGENKHEEVFDLRRK